jgi:hypothetical protein
MQYNLSVLISVPNLCVSLLCILCLLLLFSFLISKVMQKCSGAEQLIKKVERVGFEQYSYFSNATVLLDKGQGCLF